MTVPGSAATDLQKYLSSSFLCKSSSSTVACSRLEDGLMSLRDALAVTVCASIPMTLSEINNKFRKEQLSNSNLKYQTYSSTIV